MAHFTSGGDGAFDQAYADGDQPSGEMSRAGMDYAPAKRTGAFRAAGRHTARVKFLRRAIILGAVFVVSIIAIVVAFDPFRNLPRSVSIAGVGVSGTKVTMDSPKISGLQQGGGLYDVAARTGIQDITTPSVIELLGVDAHVGMSDGTTTHVLSRHGVYNSKEDTMALDGDVRIANTSGYSFGLKSAMIDFKQGMLSSEQRMQVNFSGGFVLADAVSISNNGHRIAFHGHVTSTFQAQEDNSDTEPAPPSVAAATPAEPAR